MKGAPTPVPHATSPHMSIDHLPPPCLRAGDAKRFTAVCSRSPVFISSERETSGPLPTDCTNPSSTRWSHPPLHMLQQRNAKMGVAQMIHERLEIGEKSVTFSKLVREAEEAIALVSAFRCERYFWNDDEGCWLTASGVPFKPGTELGRLETTPWADGTWANSTNGCFHGRASIAKWRQQFVGI